MKKTTIITAILLAAISTAFGQQPQKKPAPVTHIELTEKQYYRVDSMLNANAGLLINSNLPSNVVQQHLITQQQVFKPIYDQVIAQAVPIAPVVVPVKKPEVKPVSKKP